MGSTAQTPKTRSDGVSRTTCRPRVGHQRIALLFFRLAIIFMLCSNLIIVSKLTSGVTVSSQNRTLVIIIGSLRCQQAWDTLFRQVLDPNMADLALSVGLTAKNDSSLHQRAKYIWNHAEYDDWGNAIDLIPNIDPNWRHTILPRYASSRPGGIFGGVQNESGSAAVIYMARFFLAQKLLDLDLVERYDYFVVTRADHFYRCLHNISMLDFDTPDTVYTPGGQDYGGITDRHLVATKHNILRALDIYPSFLRNGGNCTLLKRNKYGHDPEWLLGCRWKQEGLQRRIMRRVMYTCATDSDSTRWSQRSKFKVPEGVHIKYQSEYEQVYETCPDKHDYGENFCAGCRFNRADDCTRLATLFIRQAWSSYQVKLMSRAIAAQKAMQLLPNVCNKNCRLGGNGSAILACSLFNHSSKNVTVLCPECRKGKCSSRLLSIIKYEEYLPVEQIGPKFISGQSECQKWIVPP